MMEPTLPEYVRFGREVCGDLEQAERREWWLSNGLGAYAAGTVGGSLTRRYHGLLIAPVDPPLGRQLLFARAEASLVDGGQIVTLYTNRWGSGVVDPQGHIHMESFHLEGRMPVWRFAHGHISLEARIWMEPGAHVTYLAYRLESQQPETDRFPQLKVRLLINKRDHHVNTRQGDFNVAIEGDGQRLRVLFDPKTILTIQASGGNVAPERTWPEETWIEDFYLTAEAERGLPERDSHLAVGEAVLQLRPHQWVGIAAGLGDVTSPDLQQAMERFHLRDRQLLARARAEVPEMREAPPWIDQLVLAADSFIFERPLPEVPDGKSVIAGYPWFGDWGRDTMIALPGLTLATGHPEKALLILETFARFVDQGMLPNVFPGSGERPAYNTVDAALWYLEAWRAYMEREDDLNALRRNFSVLQEIIQWYGNGTRYGIHMDPADGLLVSGESGVQLTWMDAKVGDWVVTPRTGKAVEINALWYNALKIMERFAHRLGQREAPYQTLAEKVRRGFQRFRKPADSGLFDVLDGPEGDDGSIRPNQIFAVSLPHSPLRPEDQVGVIEQCGRELLCSYGLRSLAPSHPDYRPRYGGGVWERDGSYHQGTLWAWLLGHYALAEYRLNGDATAARKRLEPIRDHLLDAGLGTVSEIFDAEPPHVPRGAPVQAWSVACVLQAWVTLTEAVQQEMPAEDERREPGQDRPAVSTRRAAS